MKSLFNKNKGSKKKYKKICTGHYEVIDISLESPRVLLNMADTGIVGSSKLAQRVSKLIIMVSKDLPGTPDETEVNYFRKMGLDIWEYDDRDVYYIAGSLNNFFNAFVYMSKNKVAASIVDYLFTVLCNVSYLSKDKYGAEIFTDEQLNYMASMGSLYQANTSNVMDEDRMKEMKELIDAKHLGSYELTPIVLSIDDRRKNTAMEMADEYFVGKNRVVLYLNAFKLHIIGDVIPEFGIPEDYQQDQYNDYNPDMVATEVVE